jgi:hypothetical protein
MSRPAVLLCVAMPLSFASDDTFKAENKKEMSVRNIDKPKSYIHYEMWYRPIFRWYPIFDMRLILSREKSRVSQKAAGKPIHADR